MTENEFVPWNELANAIIAQAVRDYLNTIPGSPGEKSAVVFFQGDWCDCLLRMNPHITMTGRDVLNVLKRRKAEKLEKKRRENLASLTGAKHTEPD